MVQVISIEYPPSVTDHNVAEESVFETTEALLMAVSPGFCERWNKRLESKLADLSRLMESDHS